MKFNHILFTVTAMFVVIACNNSSESPSTDEDSSTNNAIANQSTDTTNSLQSSADFMKPMNDMMGKMRSMQMSGDFDADFANMMIEHHQGGIDMAQIEVNQGRDEKLKAKAREMLNKQKEEQQQLRQFAGAYKPKGMKHGEGELGKEMDKMSSMMQSMKMSGDVDKDFASMMMHHHEHGIAMAKMELKHGMSGELKKMAQKSIDDQQKDNKELQTWVSEKSK